LNVDNNKRGCVAEYMFAIECMRHGHEVSFPLMDSSIYDCIVDTGDRLIRVQIKSTTKLPDKHHTTVHCRLQNSKSDYSIDKVDFFAVWVEYYKGFFVFPNIGEMQSVRLSPVGKHKDFFNNFVFDL